MNPMLAILPLILAADGPDPRSCLTAPRNRRPSGEVCIGCHETVPPGRPRYCKECREKMTADVLAASLTPADIPETTW